MGVLKPMPENTNRILESAEKNVLERAKKAAEQLAQKLDANNAELHREALATPERFVSDMTTEFTKLIVHRKFLVV